MSFGIKLQKINLNACEEYKIEREAHNENVPVKRADFFINASMLINVL